MSPPCALATATRVDNAATTFIADAQYSLVRYTAPAGAARERSLCAFYLCRFCTPVCGHCSPCCSRESGPAYRIRLSIPRSDQTRANGPNHGLAGRIALLCELVLPASPAQGWRC